MKAGKWRIFMMMLTVWSGLHLAGCGEEAPPPQPASAPEGGAPTPGPEAAGGAPASAPGPGVAASGSQNLSGEAKLPPSNDPLLENREKMRMQAREESIKKEEEEKKRTLVVTENPIFDTNLGRFDPFLEVRPQNDLNPIVGFTINPDNYRVTGFGKQGNIRLATLQLGVVPGIDSTNVGEQQGDNRKRYKTVAEGEGFFNDYVIKDNDIYWRGIKVVDGQILMTGEVVDALKIRRNMVIVSEVNMDDLYVILRTLPQDKYPSRQVKLSLKSAGKETSDPKDKSTPDGLSDSQTDDYIKYLEEKTSGNQDVPQDFNAYVRDKATRDAGVPTKKDLPPRVPGFGGNKP